MPLNSPASTTHLPDIAASESQQHSNRLPASSGRIQQLTLDIWKFKSTIGFSGSVVLSLGVMLAAVCAIGAVLEGMAYSMAIAAGYCMLVCSVCLCAALTIVLKASPKAAPVGERLEPSYAAWKTIKSLRVSDASRLWCNIEPGCAASQESLAWAKAMFDAIKSGELPVTGAGPDTADRERANPSWATEVERGALKRWAAAYGHAPRFLEG
jgi:hypothetical protein